MSRFPPKLALLCAAVALAPIAAASFFAAMTAVAYRLRAYAVTSARRAETLPDVPTVAESGVPGYEYTTWYGLLAPAGVPRAMIEQLNKASAAVLNRPEIRQRYLVQGLTPIPSTSTGFTAHLRSETEKWTKVVRAAKIPLQ